MIIISTPPIYYFKTQTYKQYSDILLLTVKFLEVYNLENSVMYVVDTILILLLQLKQKALRLITQHSVAVHAAHLAADCVTSIN